MNERPAPVSVYLTATGRGYVFVWSPDNRPDGVFHAGCDACGWAARPDDRAGVEEAANVHAHYCHVLPREQWPEFLTDGM
jgi:hypothetical protein